VSEASLTFLVYNFVVLRPEEDAGLVTSRVSREAGYEF
jgi:hypothetical protein